MSKPVIICVDDEPIILESLEIELSRLFGDRYLIEAAAGGEEALELFEELLAEDYDVAVVMADYLMPDIRGDELLKQIHQLSPPTLKIMLTGQADIEAVSNSIKYASLYRYIAKPWQSEDLKLTIVEAVHSYLQRQKLEEQKRQLREMNENLQELTRQQSRLIAQLQESEGRLTKFLDAMPVGVGVADAEGQLYYMNQKAEDILGRGILTDVPMEKLAEAYQVYRVGTEEYCQGAELPLFQALQGKSVESTDLELRRQEKTVPLDVWATPIYDEQGKVVYAINVFQDVTERKKAEREKSDFTHALLQLNLASGRFVPRQFLQLLNKKSIVEVKLGDAVEQEMSILFADIRNFTALSERLTLADNFQFINDYFSFMEPAIVENKGFIDKYIGDGIIALFSGAADDAVRAGLMMLEGLRKFNLTREKVGESAINIGIGINTGRLMLGTVGGRSRLDTSVISDAVNLTSRIESLTKEYGVSFFISGQTYTKLANPVTYALRQVAYLEVRAQSPLLPIYEVFEGDRPDIKMRKIATKELFAQALSYYSQQAWFQAAELFQACWQQNPEDKAAYIYWQKCQEEI